MNARGILSEDVGRWKAARRVRFLWDGGGDGSENLKVCLVINQPLDWFLWRNDTVH